jgi:hypothetical protein
MHIKSFFFFIVMFLISISNAVAQCPMCKMSAESNLKNGGTFGNGLNAGILYMLCVPYILVAGIGFWWYRNRNKEQVVDQSPENI